MKIAFVIILLVFQVKLFAQVEIDTTYYKGLVNGNKTINGIYKFNLVDSSKALPLLRQLKGNYVVTYYEPLEIPYELKAANQFSFSDNYQSGSYTGFYKNGQKAEIINFTNGRIDGEYKYFDSTGKILIDGKFDKNAKTGNWKYYDSISRVTSVGNYNADVRIYVNLYYLGRNGFNAIYGKDNKLIGEYSDAEFHDAAKSIFIDGGFTLPFAEYFKDGNWKYWKDGKLVKTELWKKGKLIKSKLY